MNWTWTMMNSNVDGGARAVIESLNKRFSCVALVHEAALWAWHLSYSDLIASIDCVVPTDEYDAAYPAAEDKQFYDDGAVRIWPSEVLFADDFRNHLVWVESLAVFAIDPESVLELLPLAPDYQQLLEARARLAMLLHADEMTDEELLEFNKYVSGI